MNLYAIYRMVPFVMTLSGPQLRFQGHDIITLSQDSKTIITCQITRKRCKEYLIELYLQWQTNNKSYDLLIGAIFNDLEP